MLSGNLWANKIFWSQFTTLATISAPLNRLTSKEANLKGGDLPKKTFREPFGITKIHENEKCVN
jgi:hypothetical protein